jgi:hypothetical protein
MQSKEPVMRCKPEVSQREGIANRLLSNSMLPGQFQRT